MDEQIPIVASLCVEKSDVLNPAHINTRDVLFIMDGYGGLHDSHGVYNITLALAIICVWMIIK